MTLYRLLIVDDEEIITDSLYEVFSRFKPDELDVCKAYSAKEALQWMARTRIDIVLTDISMPGMNGLELSEHIRAYWPRCKTVFLTGYSNFDFIYRAIQMPNVRYVLKTEEYDKIMQTVEEVIEEIRRGNQIDRLEEQSREQRLALALLAQGDYLLHLLQESQVHCKNPEAVKEDFRSLHIGLDPTAPVVMILGRFSYPEQAAYMERIQILTASRRVWDTYLSAQVRHVEVVSKSGDTVWFIQPVHEAKDTDDQRLVRYLEGTLELVQEACLESLGLTIAFTIGAACSWEAITPQYNRLRQLQQAKVSEGLPMILLENAQSVATDSKEELRISQRVEILVAHLEADRKEKFLEGLEDVITSVIQDHLSVPRVIEAYYSLALALLSSINRRGLHEEIGDYSKLMRLDEHSSMKDALQYLSQVAVAIFNIEQLEESTSYVIDRICRYIEENLDADLSLVRLAEMSYFNPTYLSRLFKQVRGINLSEYIDQCRIARAMELLKEDELKVREVAVSVGYEAAHSFTRFFKKATAMTPQEYRDTFVVKGESSAWQ